MSEPQGQVDIYARVSRKGDKEQRSISGQVGACRAVLAERGLQPGMVHKDDGKSAWRDVPRPGWDALMARLESGQAAGVIVFDMERFARRMKDGVRLTDAAKRGLLVLDSDGEYDLSTASGEKAFNDAMAAAVYYSHRLSDRTRRGKREKAMNGETDQRRSFGFDDDGVTVRGSEAAWIRWAAEHLLHGDSQGSIVAALNKRKVLTVSGGPWTQRGLRDMLLRPRTAGHLVHNGVIVAGLPGEPILSQDDYDRLVALYAARRRGRPPSPDYLCSGMAVCGNCGTRLAGRPRYDRFYNDGQPKREYWCSPSAYGGCGRMFIDQRALDALARELALAVLYDMRHAQQVEDVAAQRQAEAAELDVQIAEAEATALQLADRLGRGEISLARYDAVTGPLDKRLAKLQQERADINGGAQDGALTAGGWAVRWDAADPAERRRLLGKALHGRLIVVDRPDPADPKDAARRLRTTGLNK